MDFLLKLLLTIVILAPFAGSAVFVIAKIYFAEYHKLKDSRARELRRAAIIATGVGFGSILAMLCQLFGFSLSP